MLYIQYVKAGNQLAEHIIEFPSSHYVSAYYGLEFRGLNPASLVARLRAKNHGKGNAIRKMTPSVVNKASIMTYTSAHQIF